LRRDQFGGTLGGSVVASRLFYSWGTGHAHRRRASTFFQFVPTAQMLAGDFSAIRVAACNGGRSIPLRAPFDREQPHLSGTLLAGGGQHRRAAAEATDPCGRVDFGRRTHNFENWRSAGWTTR